MFSSQYGLRSQSVYRVIPFAVAALIASNIAAVPAAADDRDTCSNTSGDGAIAACSRLIGRNPNDAIAYGYRAVAYGKKGDLERAIADLSRAIQLDPKDAVSFTDRGHAYEMKGDHDRAIADFNQAIRLDPTHTGALFQRGDAYRKKADHDDAIGRHDRALASYDRAIADFDRYSTLDSTRYAESKRHGLQLPWPCLR